MTNNDISKAYMGVDEVGKIYLGDALIYPTTPPTPPDYSLMPLTFEVLSAGTITWNKKGSMADRVLYYSTDNGNTWNTITSTTAGTEINVNAGNKVMFASNNPKYATGLYDGSFFGGTADIIAYGNVMSLVNRTGFTGVTEITEDWAFAGLFADNPHFHIDPNKELVLPATTLTSNCYNGMFRNTQITVAPELPAVGDDSVSLPQYCYSYMFYGCSALTSAPDLLSEYIDTGSYGAMFRGCSSLNYIKCLAINWQENCSLNWVNGVASAGTFIKAASMTSWTVGVNGIPTDWVVEDNPEPGPGPQPEPAYSAMPLTLEVVSAGTISWHTYYNTIDVKVNDGNWVTCGRTSSQVDVVINVVPGDKVSFKSVTDRSSNHFSASTAYVNVMGNPLSFQNGNNYETIEKNPANGIFRNNTHILSAEHLYLRPWSGTSYTGMFSGCTNLITPPLLPATTLANEAYKNMFAGCTSLTQAPELPATALSDSCYYGMFEGCTSLTQAPALPATTLTRDCYNRMFFGCTGITTAPDLLATTMVISCYNNMFFGCSSLNYVKCLATNQAEGSVNSYSPNWLAGTSATGTFVINPNATWTRDSGGIPTGWTVVDAS